MSGTCDFVLDVSDYDEKSDESDSEIDNTNRDITYEYNEPSVSRKVPNVSITLVVRFSNGNIYFCTHNIYLC